MIKNIVFDIGNVIVEGSPKNALKYIAMSEMIKEKIETVVFDNPKWVNLDLGIDNFNSYYEKIKEELPVDIRDLSKDVLMHSHEYRKFNEDILKLIKKLFNNYKVYILSDNNIDTFNYLRTTELNKYVSGWCVSAIYNEVKINKKLFKIFFDANGLEPAECYFIDDKLVNIQIGKEFGMNGFVLDWEKNGFANLIKDMRNNGIDI